MPSVVTTIVQSITQAPIFLSLVTLVGLLLQRKKAHEILDGVIKTLVGMSMLSAGSNLLTGTLTPGHSEAQYGDGCPGRGSPELLRLCHDAL